MAKKAEMHSEVIFLNGFDFKYWYRCMLNGKQNGKINS
jgi:hypothetical protein